MAKKRQMYKLQGTVIGEWLHRCGYGDFSVVGPRESDGAILLIHRTERESSPMVVTSDGILTQPEPGSVDPREFGWRQGVSHG
jgi:hypothetical protein